MDLVAAAKSSCGLSNFRGSGPLSAATWTLPKLTWSSFRSSAIFSGNSFSLWRDGKLASAIVHLDATVICRYGASVKPKLANIAIEGVSEN
jgi:hypothetical protein